MRFSPENKDRQSRDPSPGSLSSSSGSLLAGLDFGGDEYDLSAIDRTPYTEPEKATILNPDSETMVKPTHELPLYWRQPEDGKLARCNFAEWVAQAGSEGLIHFRSQNPVGPAVFQPRDAGDATSETGMVFHLENVTVDLSQPTQEPRDIDKLELKEVEELHKRIDEHRESMSVDLVVLGKLHGLEVPLLIDSGSTITLISRQMWSQLHEHNPGLTLIPSNSQIKTASGQHVQVAGRVLLEVNLAGQYYPWLFYVFDAAEPAIIGMDFLNWWNVTCDCRNGLLKISGREVKHSGKTCSMGDGRVRRLTVVSRTQIPANSHCVVEARVNKGRGDLPDWGMVVPTKRPVRDHGVVAGRALVDGQANTVLVPILNPTDTTVFLPQNYRIACMAPVQAIEGETLTDPNMHVEGPDSGAGETDALATESAGCLATDTAPVRAADVAAGDQLTSDTVPLATASAGNQAHTAAPSKAATVANGDQAAPDTADSPVLDVRPMSNIERLDSGTPVDVCHLVDTDDLLSDVVDDSAQPAPPSAALLEAKRYNVPEHLVELYAASVDNLETEAHREQWACFLVEYQDVFAKSADDLGRTGVVQHRIDTGGHPPIKQPPRRVPIHKRAIVEQEVAKMLHKGVIEISDSPWSSPIVLVTKKGGDTRFCVDFREVNNITRKDAYPLPRIEDNLDALQGAHWYSTLDLLSGFWQVEVAPEDRDVTAFSVAGLGLYRFVTMPFGLTNAPATFERLMERILRGLQWSIAVLYLDDVVVFANTVQDHFDRLGQVLARFREAGLKLKPSKCQLLRHRVDFLGHVVSKDGVEVDPKKVDKVVNWPPPKTLTNLRSFLGLCTYYQSFIKDYSSIARPLFALTEKGAEFIWTEGHQESFEELKRLLTSAPILAYPRPDAPFVLDTDASDLGLGAVLGQVQDGVERVIRYGSRTLQKPERNYCVTRRELLAIVTFVKQFQHYLVGSRFLVRTDHAALFWLLRKREPVGQMARWTAFLQQFDMCIEHRPGKKHGNADALSRCMEGCRDTDDWAFTPGAQATLDELQQTAHTHFSAVMTRSQLKKQKAQEQMERDQALGPYFDAATPDTRPETTSDPAKPTAESHTETKDSSNANDTSQSIPEHSHPSAMPDDGDQRAPQDEQDAPLLVAAPAVPEPEPPGGGSDDDDAAPPVAASEPQITATQDNPDRLPRLDDDARRQLQKRLANQQKLQHYLEEVLPDSWSVEAIAFIQEHDVDLKKVRAWLRAGTKPTWEQIAPENSAVKAWWSKYESLTLSPDNDVLYIQWESTGPNSPPPYRIIATRSMAPAIMRELHDSRTAAHLGQYKTVKRVHMSPFYWVGMTEYARRWVKNCNVCSARKPPQHQKRSPLQTFYYGATGDRYSCDLCGPFSPPTDRGARWILTVTDWYTRFCVAYDLKTATAEKVADKIKNFIALFGCPVELYSDNGRNLHGEVMKALCKALGVKKLATCAYRPSSNGITERENRTLKACLAAYVNARGRDWDLYLDTIMMAIRSSVHVTLGETPNMMMFARELRLPIHSYLPLPPGLAPEPLPPSQYAADLQQAMRDAHDAIVQHLNARYKYQKQNYDRQVKPVEYKVGDAVWLRVYPKPLGQSRALLKYWDEAWIVIKRISAVHYKILKTPNGQPQIVHGDRIKAHPGPLACAATKRLWLALQPDASRLDKLGLSKATRDRLGLQLN